MIFSYFWGLVAFSQISWRILAMPWIPQHGTVENPKLPELSSYIRHGDVMKVEDRYYRALTDVDLQKDPSSLENLPDDYDGAWRRLIQGSYMLPKVFDSGCDEGSLYHNGQSYFKASWDGHACSWEYVNEQENWMSLLRSEIGDTRLGDLLIPGTHDSATSGIDENSILVDRNFLFQLGEEIDKQFLANWTLTHREKVDSQLMAGFRNLDLRVADTVDIDGVFRWWHGVTGDEISEGLDQIGQFARDHPEEVLILNFQHFARPGNLIDPTYPISEPRLQFIAEMILDSMGDRMTYHSNLSSNPTVNEVLDTGANIIALMEESYIQNMDGRFWNFSTLYSDWIYVSNPEDLFIERSGNLRDFKINHADQITELSGVTTANEQIYSAALLNAYRDNETMLEIIDEVLPGILDVNPSNMSFEGLWVGLLEKARYGTTTDGMHARPEELYTSGPSVHYWGVNQQARYWVARPDLYKPNIIYTDDFVTSTLVDLAIQFNRGDIGREVSVTLQGNPVLGYFTWADDGYGTTGGTDGINCTFISLQYTIIDGETILLQDVISEFGEISIAEGTYPPTADIQLAVSSIAGSSWQQLFTENIQLLISSSFDLYVRGHNYGDGGGFAYLSSVYNDYGEDCDLPPQDLSNVIQLITW